MNNYYATFHLIDNGRTVELIHGNELHPWALAKCDSWLAQERGGEDFDFDDLEAVL